MKPFIHKFETAGNKYVYDVNSNRVFKVSSRVHDVVSEFQEGELKGLFSKFSGHSKKDIKRTYAMILSQRQNGLFSTHRPTEMVLDEDFSIEDTFARSPHEQLILNLTERCNLRCRYCVYSGHYPTRRTHSGRDMSLETAKTAVEKFLLNSTDDIYISLYGGEPLLAFGLMKEIVTHVKSLTSKKLYWNLTTNGTLLDDHVIDFLIKNDFSITVSLDGPQSIHDRYRVDAQGNGSFQRIKWCLENLAAINPEYYKTKLRFSVVNAPPFQTGVIHDFFCSNPLTRENDVSFSEMDLNITSPEFSVDENVLGLLSEQYDEMLGAYTDQLQLGNEGNQFQRAIYELSFVGLYHRLKIPLGNEIPLNGCCVPGFRRLFVTVDGALHACERIDDAYPIGNVRDWINPALYKKLVDDYVAVSEDCFQCWACRLCKECFASLPTVAGKFDSQGREQKCRGTRYHLHKMLVYYYTILEENESSLDFLAERILD